MIFEVGSLLGFQLATTVIDNFIHNIVRPQIKRRTNVSDPGPVSFLPC